MKRLDLQLFANEAVQGKKLVYLYRILSEAAKEDGTTLAFTTENGRTKSKDADSTATKDGSIRTPGAAEVEITATSILKKGDKLIDKLEKALDELSNKAIQQIKDNKYDYGLKGKVIYIGLAHHGKDLSIKWVES